MCSAKRIWAGLVFLLLLGFRTAELKSGGVENFSALRKGSCDQRKPVFQGGSGKPRDLEDPQAVFPLVSSEMGEGREEAEAS